MRERFIARKAKDIEVPQLDDPALLSAGAEHYAAMCTGCHLAPGMEDNELRAGMYPQPPNLAEHAEATSHEHGHSDAAARRQFWIIKHGVKASGMPAWGVTHDDNSIWALVAFVEKLPGMTPEEYAQLTAATPEAGNHEHAGHEHGHQHDNEASGETKATEGDAPAHEHKHGDHS